MQRFERASSATIAVVCSAVGVLFMAVVAATPGSPLTPALPADTGPSGPFRWLAGAVGLDRIHGEVLAIVSIVAVVFSAGAFLLVLREAWRGNLPARLVIGLAVSYHVVVLFLPLLFSRDVYSYGIYGRIVSVHHANPYVATPADFLGDPFSPYVGPKWFQTPAVYGPGFVALSAFLTAVVKSVSGLIVTFRLIAIGASLATVALISWVTLRLWPERRAFAIAAFGMNPVVVFQSVGSGHNDLLVALSIAAALALVIAKRELPATAVLTLGALIKFSAGVPLVLLVVVAVAGRERGKRFRALLAHGAVVGGIGAAFAVPFMQTRDPTLGLWELARHEAWLAPSGLFHRMLDAVSGDTLGVVVRFVFPALFLVALFVIARSLARRAPDVTPTAQAAAWGWGLLFLMLLAPVLLPWYVAWALSLAWALPRVPRIALLGASTALTVSQFTSEPTLFPHAYNANLWWGHWAVTPVVIALLVWAGLDFRRRVREGAPLEEQREVAAPAGHG